MPTIKAFPNQTSLPQLGGTALATFPVDLNLPTLTPANTPGYNHGEPLYIQIAVSPDAAPVTPGMTNPAYIVDIAALNVGGVLLPCSAANAGDGYGYVALYNEVTHTYGAHIPCVISAAPGNDPAPNAGEVDLLVTPVGGSWPLGKVVVVMSIGLPAVVIELDS